MTRAVTCGWRRRRSRVRWIAAAVHPSICWSTCRLFRSTRCACRLVGINEDLSKYEGDGEGPKVGKVKEAIERKE
jgi:hypothetical protein